MRIRAWGWRAGGFGIWGFGLRVGGQVGLGLRDWGLGLGVWDWGLGAVWELTRNKKITPYCHVFAYTA